MSTTVTTSSSSNPYERLSKLLAEKFPVKQKDARPLRADDFIWLRRNEKTGKAEVYDPRADRFER